MKRRLIPFLLMMFISFSAAAKYCPTCLETFQAQTIRGQTELLYRWMVRVMDPKESLKYGDIKQLFDKKVTIVVNGVRVANGLSAVKNYFARMRRRQVLQESELRSLIVEGQYAVIKYEQIKKRKGKLYRSIIIVILKFREHKVIDWSAVSHTSPIKV